MEETDVYGLNSSSGICLCEGSKMEKSLEKWGENMLKGKTFNIRA